MGLAALRRYATAAPAAAGPGEGRAAERCELCGAVLDDGHGHLVEPGRRSLVCACRACHLLFTRDGAGAGRLRAVPRRFLSDDRHPLTGDDWNELDIPVAPAFVSTNSEPDRVVAGYPSPAGVTECLPDPAAWHRLRRAYPLLAAPAADVEAVYVTRTGDRLESFLVPIDACFALAGEIRLRWRGLDGGDGVRRTLAAFLDDVRARARPLRAGGAG